MLYVLKKKKGEGVSLLMSLDVGSKQFMPCLQCFPDKRYQYLIDVEKRTFNCDTAYILHTVTTLYSFSDLFLKINIHYSMKCHVTYSISHFDFRIVFY